MSKITDLKDKKCKIVIGDGEITIEAPLPHAKRMLLNYIEEEKEEQAAEVSKKGEKQTEEGELDLKKLPSDLSDAATQVARIVRKAGEIKRYQLTNSMSSRGYSIEQYKEALSELEERGLISSEIKDTGKRGKPPKVYKWLGVD